MNHLGQPTLDPATVASHAARLGECGRSGAQIAHVSAEHPGMALADACAVQQCWVDAKIAAGRRMIGHKIGLTSRAMERASDITKPDYFTRLDDVLLPDGRDAHVSRFIGSCIDVELAFIRRTALAGPGSIALRFV